MRKPALTTLALPPLMFVALLTGCRAKPAVTDDQLTASIQTQLAQDSALAGQQISVSVQNGVATLNGLAANPAQRTIAARDAAGVSGVKEVINSIGVGTASITATAPAPVPLQTRPAAPITSVESRRELDRDAARERAENHAPAPIERTAQSQPYPAQPQPQPYPAQPQPSAAMAPPPPPQPVIRTVTIQAGDALPVRVTQTLDSASAQVGDSFSGVLASDVMADGVVALPAGTPVSGSVTAVQEAAHFKGSALLTVALTSVRRHGEPLSVATDPYTVKGKGRGANTAEKTGGGAAVGAILGGIFGGGKGAAIGAAAGGGAGAGVNGVTRGQQVQIGSESIVRFQLTSPITLKVRIDQGAHHDHDDQDGLQRHP